MKGYKSFIMLSAFWALTACGDTASSSADDDYVLRSPTDAIEAPIKDYREDRVYYTTQIGTQVWFEENLQYKADPSWCYNDADSNCVEYGRLYAGGLENLCPEKFHVPSEGEWRELIDYVKVTRPETDPIKSLKEYSWHPGEGFFHFHLRGAGYRWLDDSYQKIDEEAYMATSQSGCYLRILPGTDYDFVCEDSIAGFSVRCLMDSTNAKDMLPSCGSSNKYELVHEGNGYYVCDEKGWRPANRAEYNAYGNKCVNGAVVEGNFYQDHYYDRYICDGGLWREATEIERNTYGNECVAGSSQIIKGVVEDFKYFICTDSGFRRTTMWDFQKSDYLNPSIAYETLVDARDQKSYKTVSLGTQVWMAENLNYADSARTPNLKGNSWCYEDNPSNCEKVGHYYTFLAAMDLDASFADDSVEYPLASVNQGICPDGWRIPSEEDWNTLVTYILATYGEEANAWWTSSITGDVIPNDYYTVPYAMKSVTAWNFEAWTDPANASGFSVIPAGHRTDEGEFVEVGERDGFWLASIHKTQSFIAGAPAGMDLAKSISAPSVADMNTWQITGWSYNMKMRKSGYPIRCVKN